jgi:hypothetical protein
LYYNKEKTGDNKMSSYTKYHKDYYKRKKIIILQKAKEKYYRRKTTEKES